MWVGGASDGTWRGRQLPLASGTGTQQTALISSPQQSSAADGLRIWASQSRPPARRLTGPAGRSVLCALALTLLVLAAGVASTRSARQAAAVDARGTARQGLTALPAAARETISSTLGRDDPSYAARRAGGTLIARGAGLTARFGTRGVEIRSGREQLGVRLAGFGADGSLRPIAPAEPRAQSNRVFYAHGSVTESYANGPLGLEQGFTITSQSARPAVRTLTLALAVSGNLHPTLAHGTVTFSGSGGAALTYGGLFVSDAVGRHLPATIVLADGRLLIRVDVAGARYPLRVDPLIQAAGSLTPSDVSGDAGFGMSASLSANGDVALIGGPTDDNYVGAAWIFTRSGATWTEAAKIVAPTIGPDAEAPFGHSLGAFGWSVVLSADGTQALIGDYSDNSELGAVWYYTGSGSSWVERQKIVAPTSGGDAALGVAPSFGNSVALSPDGATALIGGDGDNYSAMTGSIGAVWVYTLSGASWTEQKKLVAPTVGPEAENGGANFGFSVALGGTNSSALTALIGGALDNANVGAAWVYTGSGSSWTGPTKLTAPTSGPDEEIGEAEFGCRVALSTDGSTALIAGDEDNSNVGAAWVYTGSGSSWAEQAKLTAPTSGSDAQTSPGGVGVGLALSGNGTTALIGAYDGTAEAGNAWIFTGSGSSWAEQAELSVTPSGDGATDGAIDADDSAALSANGQIQFVGTGDDQDRGAASVFLIATSATLGVSNTAPVIGAPVTYTASVSPRYEVGGGEGQPSGPVAFLDAGTPIPTCASQLLTVGSPSTASCTVSYASAGDHTISASYSGDGTFATAASAATAVSVSIDSPVLQQSTDAQPVSGTVSVKLPGSSTFVPLSDAENIPLGSTLNTTNGTVQLTFALPTGSTQTGEFYDGEFTMDQASNGRVTLTLVGGSFKGCPAPKRTKTKTRGPVARSAQAKKTKTTVVRKLWGNAHGSYTTSARTASASVLGTIWLTEDLCEGSYFKVTQDTISVTAFATPRVHRVIKQGHSILVLARGFQS